jgi:hypothetical protein
VAVQTARKLTSPPHPIDVRLRNAANEWLRKFGAKADLSLLGGVLGSSANGIHSQRQIREIMFAFLVNKIAAGSIKDVERFAKEASLRAVFPDGLYSHFIKYGWPNVPFGYARVDFGEILKTAMARAAEEGRDWQPVIRLSSLFFGEGDAPRTVDDLGIVYIGRFMERLHKNLKSARQEQNEHPTTIDWHYWARVILGDYYSVEAVSCVIHGSDRANGKMMNGRFGLSEQDFESWIKIVS